MRKVSKDLPLCLNKEKVKEIAAEGGRHSHGSSDNQKKQLYLVSI
ncbi:MAG: KGG domain-containing protein [Candidatus Paracaedibacteraceae bacterium]|nr:KGG domain-containing protein [Candidatus Paracaedibacteraceae bacterium]